MPLDGEFRSNQIGVFTGSGIILVIAYLSIRWIGATSRSDLLMVGACAIGAGNESVEACGNKKDDLGHFLLPPIAFFSGSPAL